jgi:hypothetical protein
VSKECDFGKMLMEDFNYEVPRDKVRHDLTDRLVGQGFMAKWPDGYHITVKGMARYEYCLAKYTTCGTADADVVLQVCMDQRDKIFNRYRCI